MFTVLACLFVLFAADGFFHRRTLNDDEWDVKEKAKKSAILRRLRPILWGGLAIVCLIIASRFEW